MQKSAAKIISANPDSFKFAIPPFTWLAVFLHLLIALPLAWKLNIWLDEGWTMQTTGAGIVKAWSEALAVERQAPLYFVIAAFLRGVFDSLFLVRLFSIGCSVLTIISIAPLVRRFASANSKPLQNLLPLIVALNPYLIWASTEARVYALVIVLAAWLMLFWFDGYALEEKKQRTSRLIYVVLAVLSLYTNYYLGFVLVAGAGALLALGRRKAFWDYVWQMLIVGAFFLPLALVVKAQMETNSDYFFEKPGLIGALKLLWSSANNFLLPAAEWETTAFFRVWLSRAALILLLIYLTKNFRQIPAQVFALGVIVLVIGAFLIAAYFLLGIEYVQIRHFAPLFVPLVIFFAALVYAVVGRRGLYVWAILLLIFVPTRIFYNYSPPVKNGNWNEVSRLIESNERENQPITLFQLQDSIPFKYVYHGKNSILPSDKIGDWRPQGAPHTRERWRGQIETLISQIPPEQEYLWLVTSLTCEGEDSAIECRPLEEYIAANYATQEDERLFSRRVRLLRRKK